MEEKIKEFFNNYKKIAMPKELIEKLSKGKIVELEGKIAESFRYCYLKREVVTNKEGVHSLNLTESEDFSTFPTVYQKIKGEEGVEIFIYNPQTGGLLEKGIMLKPERGF